jgi:transposase InsO family protein
LFLDNIYRLHGFPTNIVSDRGLQFISKFWKRFFKLLKVKINLSFAYHPETHGQTECVNQILEQYLQCTINNHQDNWVDLFLWQNLLIIILCILQLNKLLFIQIMVNILKEIFFQLIAVGSPAVEVLVGHITTIYNELKLQL